MGATLGGGFRFLTRALGMTCDNLSAAELVVAEPRGPRLIQAAAHAHPDLLWACRGGGDGNFGIVTALTYRTHCVGDVAFLVGKWPDLSAL